MNWTWKKAGFLRRFVTMNKTWIHHYTPEAKKAVKTVEWTRRISSKKGEKHYICWEGEYVSCLWREAIRKGKTLTWEYYAPPSGHIEDSDRGETSGNNQKKGDFHHDNAPLYSSHLSQQKLTELYFGLLLHSLFTRSVSFRLPSVPETQNLSGWTKTRVQ